MSKDKIQKADKQELSLVVRAIGTDLEYTQVRMITSANANMLFHSRPAHVQLEAC